MDDGIICSQLARTVGTAAVVVLVLGVLPLAWDAPGVWQVLGPIVAAAYAVRAVRAVWDHAFSTASPELTRRD